VLAIGHFGNSVQCEPTRCDLPGADITALCNFGAAVHKLTAQAMVGFDCEIRRENAPKQVRKVLLSPRARRRALAVGTSPRWELASCAIEPNLLAALRHRRHHQSSKRH